MKDEEGIRKAMLSSDTEEVIKILETLDASSKILAGTYLAALSDRQKLEDAQMVAV